MYITTKSETRWNKRAGVAVTALLIASVLLISVFAVATHANAQTPTTKASGKYVNSKMGVEIVFPEGWIIEDVSREGTVQVSAASGKDLTKNALMFLQLVDSTPGVTVDDLAKSIQSDAVKSKCEIFTFSPTKLNGIDTIEIGIDCTGISKPIITAYLAIKEGKRITLGYAASTHNVYNANITKFEESAQTFKMTGAAGIKTEIPKDLKTIMQKVKVAGNDIDLKIDSSSRVSNFTFSERNKQISFKVAGDDGTEGVTVIQVSKVLHGPYTVMFDGRATTNFETMKEQTGETSIKLTYKHSTHDITITGASVVPEFSAMAALVLAASLLTIIVFTAVARKSEKDRLSNYLTGKSGGS